jgi:hypothetical protein
MTEMGSPALVVLAAGMGSRYGGLKQMDAVGPSGETILDYSIYDALRAGFGKIVFVIRKDIEREFRERVGARFESSVAVEYVFQELDKLPQGFNLPDGFAVINADDFYGAASYRVLAEHFESGSEDAALVGFALRNTLSEFGAVARGVCAVSGSGYLEQVVELTKIQRVGDRIINRDGDGGKTLTGDEVVSMNMWGLRPGIFGALEEQFREFLGKNALSMTAECYLPTAINQLVEAGEVKVRVLKSDAEWFGVTYREDRPRTVDAIQHLIDGGLYPQRLWGE